MTVVVVTVNFLDRGSQPQTVVPRTEAYQGDVPILVWYEQIGERRGSTLDDPRVTYIVEPFLGYDGENNALVAELIQREVRLIGIINDYFGSHHAEELQGLGRQDIVEQELLEQINRVLRDGRVQEIVWGNYQFLPF